MSPRSVDVVVTWPTFCDFPKWRAQMNEYRDEFARIIIVLSRSVKASVDHSDWLRENFPTAEFHEAVEHGGDWRNDAVNTGLDVSDAERVLFTEPDFFFERLHYRLIAASDVRVAGVRCAGGERWHPCFILADRDAVEATTRNFGATHDYDHFTRFSEELPEVADVTGDWYTHMQALTEAHHQVDLRWPVSFDPDGFAAYLRECLGLGVSLPEEWEATTRRWLEQHATQP